MPELLINILFWASGVVFGAALGTFYGTKGYIARSVLDMTKSNPLERLTTGEARMFTCEVCGESQYLPLQSTVIRANPCCVQGMISAALEETRKDK